MEQCLNLLDVQLVMLPIDSLIAGVVFGQDDTAVRYYKLPEVSLMLHANSDDSVVEGDDAKLSKKSLANSNLRTIRSSCSISRATL